MKIDHASLTGSTPLHFACFRNNFTLAKKLIEAGANVNVGKFNTRRQARSEGSMGHSTLPQKY